MPTAVHTASGRGRPRPRRRLRPAGRVSSVLPALVVLFALAVLPGSTPAASGHRYGDIPARRWDWDELSVSSAGRALADQELRRQGEYARRWHAVHEIVGPQHVSRKGQDLLRRRGLGPALLDRAADPRRLKTTYDGRDTLRVLIVRISFNSNRDSNLTTIAPDGNFDLSVPTEPEFLAIDPPPHDKAFYEAHLQGLSEYYRFQSGDRLFIEGRVLPEDPLGSYKLSDVADYGPGSDGFWTLAGLESLVREMIKAADEGAMADGSAILADYDDDNPFTYVIFVHAGSDWQSDINGDSPNDIPTFFVTLGEPQALSTTDSGSGAPGLLSECSVIPETTSQDGYPGSIAAAFYHEFGHALGLIDVYNTYSATPTAGIWDLMDSGTNLSVTLGDITDQGDTVFVVATGVLPPSLGAWNKWFLGWLQTDEIAGQSLEYRLPAVGVPRSQYQGGSDPIYTSTYGDFNLAYPQAWRAGVSPREWFLLENRWVPLDVGETPFLGLSFERDEQTGVIMYLAGEKPPGFWRNSGLYDYFMPAGGLLVWHVNADRIEAGLADNTVNTEGDGLALVEADGIRDIGVLDSYVLGWFGSERDPFGAYDALGNRVGNDNLYVEGVPNSRAWDRSWTGLSLTNVRPNARDLNSVLRFGAAIEPLAAGFPWELPDNGPGVPRALDPDSPTPVAFADGPPVLIFADEPPLGWAGGPYPSCLFGLAPDGQPRWPAVPDLPTAAFQELTAPLAGPCTVIAEGTDAPIVLWSTTDGRVGLTDLPAAGVPVPRWTIRAGAALAGPALFRAGESGGGRILVPVSPDTVVVLDLADGLRLHALDLGDHEFQGGIHLASAQQGGPAFAFMRDGWFTLVVSADTDEVQTEFHPYGRVAASGTLRPALWAEDAGWGLAVFDADGLLGSWLGDGGEGPWSPGPDFPLSGPLVADPAVADLDGDGRHDLIFGTASRIHAFSTSGVPVRGWPATLRELFPLADTTRIQGPLIVADGTGDGVNEVYFATDGGHLLGLDAGGGLLARTPFRWGDRRSAGMAVGPAAAAGQARILWLFSQGGYAGPPLERQLTGGRIAGYALAPVAPDGGTSQWLGPRGGSARSGATGPARALGDLAPALAEVDQAVLYPNPLTGADLTVRFYNQGSDPARFGVYTLEGEAIVQRDVPVTAGVVNEFKVALPGLASGLYVCRLECDTTAGRRVRTLTLAVQK